MKKRVLIGLTSLVIILVGYFAVKGNKGDESADILVSPEVGRFEVLIETTGELEAKNSTKILGPSRLRDFRIYQVAINEIVEEGPVVGKGDWVATLDNSELLGKVQDAQLEVDKMQSQYTQTQLDTALQMRQARDELINLAYTVTEREIELDQSKFEPPATQRQADMNLDKAKRALQQAKENYSIKEQQNIAKMAEVNANLQKEMRDMAGMQNLLQSFRIIAPEDGMVIYKKGFDGKAMKEGSTISAWDPTVAELPDLTTMISKTYVNEVDVRKIKSGQQVDIGLDAFPEKRLKGQDSWYKFRYLVQMIYSDLQ
jgi:multidrug resistance efflux pump